MSDAEKTKKSSKLHKLWKRDKTKVKRFKAPEESSEPCKDEATTSTNHKASRFNIFKKKKTPVKPFTKQNEQESGEDTDKSKWNKVKLSSTAVMPSDIYKKK